MIKKAMLAMAVVAAAAGGLSAEDLSEYRFKLWMLVKGRMIKDVPLPDYGYMRLTAFPVRVREFVEPEKYMDYKEEKEIAKKAEGLASGLAENRRKNALHVSAEIFRFVKEEIQDDAAEDTVAGDAHSAHRSAGETLAAGKGTNIEKCRLAVAMLRSLTIPANIVFYRGHYAVEYFMKPLKGDSGWFLMDPAEETAQPDAEAATTAAKAKGAANVYPVTWYPLDAKELLNEEWDNADIILKAVAEKNYYYPDDYESVRADWDGVTLNGKTPESGAEEPGKKFYVMREVGYLVKLKKPEKGAANFKIKFTLPFNERDTFKIGSDRGSYKTVKYFIKSESDGLSLSYRRAHVITKPPQRGITFYLPVEFKAE